MRFTVRALVVTASLVLAAAAVAQPRPGGGGPRPPTPPPPGGGDGAPGGMIVKINAEQLAQLFTEAGFPSKVIDNNKTHMVQTQFWTEDVFSGAIPEACDDDGSGCHVFKIFANLGADAGITDAWINAWNSRYWFARAYKLDNGALIFAFDVPLWTGLTPDYIKTAAAMFKKSVDESTDFKP
jgi:hypothetical protein